MKKFAALVVDRRVIGTIARLLFALVFILFGIGKFNIDDAMELAGLVTTHPVLNIPLNLLGPITFAKTLGFVELVISLLLLVGIKSPKVGLIGALLATGTFLVTSSLILFAEIFRENAGFPFGNFTGLFLFKDLGLLACALLLATIDAERLVNRNS